MDQELALWMVFDRRSIDPRAAGWYPLPCRLLRPFLKDAGAERRNLSYVSKEPPFDIACFLPSLRDLAEAEFETASEKIQEKPRSGEVRVCQVERSEVEKLLETKSAARCYELFDHEF